MDSSTSADDRQLDNAQGFMGTMRRLGPARLSIMGAVIFMLLIFFVFVSVRVSSPTMSLLYSDLSVNDARQIALALDNAGVKYQTAEDNTQVLVDEGDVAKARLLLAKEGLPSSGNFGYELFDSQSGFGTTNFQDQMNKQRALEGELSRTISAIDQVNSARVHIVLPERELFSREARPASASVFLNLSGKAELGREQVLSIQSLVSSAVPGMKASQVSVMDSEGNLLARGGEEDDALQTVKAEEMRNKYEQRLTSSIENLLGRTVGFGKVRAMVTADLNFDRISQNEEIYNPEGQVVRSSQTVEENAQERQPQEQSVGVQNNLPNAGGDLLLGDQPTSQNNRVEETTNYEISKTTRNTIREAGEVNRLSIAVMVDGTYTKDAEGNEIYQPRSQEELDKLAVLVQSAVGYDASRGDSFTIESMQFADIDTGDTAEDTKILGFERADLLDAAEILTVAIMIILVVLLVLQPMVGKLIETQEKMGEKGDMPDMLPGMSSNPALTGPGYDGFRPEEVEEGSEDGMIDMNRVQGQVKASSLKKVEDIVSSYPGETVSVLRSWMGQE
ncbi:MAG: flagellar basal-body MS-ring/collar protein FliF [Pseudobdellovibrionaceae bacterium]